MRVDGWIWHEARERECSGGAEQGFFVSQSIIVALNESFSVAQFLLLVWLAHPLRLQWNRPSLSRGYVFLRFAASSLRFLYTEEGWDAPRNPVSLVFCSVPPRYLS